MDVPDFVRICDDHAPHDGRRSGLTAAVNGIWVGTGDAADVVALYAPHATLLDTIDGKTYTGLEAIEAKVDANASAAWVCEQTSDPIQQGNLVAAFHRFPRTRRPDHVPAEATHRRTDAHFTGVPRPRAAHHAVSGNQFCRDNHPDSASISKGSPGRSLGRIRAEPKDAD